METLWSSGGTLLASTTVGSGQAHVGNAFWFSTNITSIQLVPGDMYTAQPGFIHGNFGGNAELVPTETAAPEPASVANFAAALAGLLMSCRRAKA